jgi:hypothetical protein
MHFQETPLGAGSGLANVWITQKLQTAETSIGGYIARAKMDALKRGREFSANIREGVGSLQSLLPSSVTTRLRDAGQVATHQIADGFASAFKHVTSHFTKKAERPQKIDLGDMITELPQKTHIEVLLHSLNGTASTEDKKIFNENKNNGQFNALASFQEVTKQDKFASKVRTMYEHCQGTVTEQEINSRDQNFQSKLAQLKSYLSELSPEDRQKFLSLSPEELMAVQMYTGDTDYRLINSILDGGIRNLQTCLEKQGDDVKNLDTQKLFDALSNVIKLVASAINKLPQFNDKVYRASWEDPSTVAVYKTAYEKKKSPVLMYEKFVSTTKSEQVAENFDLASDHKGRIQVVYEMEPPDGHALNGADISFLSAKDGEEEVLLKPGTGFTVVGYREISAGRDENGVKHTEHIRITLKQLPPNAVGGT